MKTLIKILDSLRKKNFKFYPSSSVIILVVLILFATWISGSFTKCLAQSPWSQKTNMPTAKMGHAMAVLDGKIYAIGGSNSTYGDAFKMLEVYDPVSDTWSVKKNMNSSRAAVAACVYDGKIYAFGGGAQLWSSPVKTMEVYDPATDTWTYKANMPRERYEHAAVLVDNKMYLIGGTDISLSNFISEVDVYDPLTDSWETVTSLPSPRAILSAVELNGKIIVLAGFRSGHAPSGRVDEYDPVTNQWSVKAPMLVRCWQTATDTLDGKIYVFGGAPNTTSPLLTEMELYDPVTDTWTMGFNMPDGLCGHSGASMDGKFYISGGSTTQPPFTVISTMLEYDAHRDLYPLVKKADVNNSYIEAGTGSVCITVKMSDPTGITIMARIENPDQTPVDSIQLFDDGMHNDGNAGDSLYANVWPVIPTEEQQYYIDLHVTRIESDTIIHHFGSMTSFTTIGPVEIEKYTITSLDTVFNPGDMIEITLTLKNNGSTVTAPNIEATLTSLDTLVSVSTWSRTYGDIAAGENSASSYYRIKIYDEWTGISQVPILVEITSDGYAYWKDTLYITVQGPTSMEDIREPMARLYPNPTNDVLNIEINNTGNQGLVIDIYNITGKLIYQKEYKTINAHFAEQFDLSGYSKGIYLVKVKQANTVYVGKVVVR